MSCPDCKDGFYYPFVGEPEPCQTCKGKISPDYCNTCEGTNYFLSHPEGTPGPCPDCNGDPSVDTAFYEGDSSKDVSFDRQCRTAFNDIVNKDRPCIYYSKNSLLTQRIEFYSTAPREERISRLMCEIQCQLNAEGAWMYNVNILDSKFFEVWDHDAIGWKTGVYLKIASVWRT